MLMNFMRQHVEIQRKKCLLSQSQLNELNKKISCVNRNRSHIANHYFINCKSLFTKTTTANECRHKNYKHGEDRVEPNFNMAQSAHKMNEKRKHGINRKLKREANLISAISSCTTNISNEINPKALQWFYNMWKNKDSCVYMRVDYETWHVMRLHYDFDSKNNVKPIFKRVRIVKLINRCYLVCSCKKHINIGVGCVHIASIINEITVHFWHMMHHKSYNFYYLRKGTSD